SLRPCWNNRRTRTSSASALAMGSSPLPKVQIADESAVEGRVAHVTEGVGKTVAVALLLLVAATGVRAVIDPDRFVRRSGMPRGGEMLRTWNRDGVRGAGAIFVVVAVYMLYHLLSD